MTTSTSITRRSFLTGLNASALLVGASSLASTQAFGAVASRAAGSRQTLVLCGAEYGFRWIPCAESPTSGVWMLETPCAQRLWTAVIGSNPSDFRGDELPVEQVSYEDCELFLSALNEMDLLPSGYAFRLPTETEWQRAAQCAASTRYWWGNALKGDRANCDGNYPIGAAHKGPYVGRTTPVKAYGSSPWGLYDMVGNVWEWCASESLDSRRVFCGGSWSCDAASCGSDARCYGVASDRNNCLGFRFVIAQS